MGVGPARPYVSRRQFLQRSAAVGLVTASGPFFWQQPAYSAEVPAEQLHGQFGGDAGREAAFSWMTPVAVAAPFLQLGGQRVPAQTVQYPGYPGFFHHVRLSDLLPGTSYPYAVGHAGAVQSEMATWRTGPRPGTPFMFTAFGDQGTDAPEPGTVQDVDPRTLQGLTTSQPPFQASLNRDLAQSMEPAFHAIVGDTAYANGDQDIWDLWFRGIAPMAASVPWMPCLGNHEIESMGAGIGGFNVSEEAGLPGADSWGPLGYDAYRTRFALPANGDAEWEGCWYRFRYGSVEFVSLDNNDVNTEVPANIGYSKGRQKAWAEKVLAAAAADPECDFIIVLMHQAAFSSGLHGSDPGVREAWFPLFTRYGVDLVLQGHDHHYERTHLMRDADVLLASDGDYVSDVGTMYVVAGNGGALQRGEGLQRSDFTAAIEPGKIGTLKVEVVPDTGKGTKRLVLGEYDAITRAAIEEGVVIERTRTVVQPVAAPAAPPAPSVPAPAAPTVGEGAVQPVLAATGSPAGISAAGVVLGAGAAAAALVWKRTAEEAADEA